MQRRTSFIEDLSRSDLDVLAQLLSFANTGTGGPSPNSTNNENGNSNNNKQNNSDKNKIIFPPENWLASQRDAVAALPAHLVRSTALLPRLAMRMPFAAPRAVLCDVHKPLNPFLMRRIFMQVSAETGLRVQSLIGAVERECRDKEKGKVKGKGKGGDDDSDDDDDSDRVIEMNAEVRAWLRRLTALNSLWMSPNRYRTKFHAALHSDGRGFERVESGCEACIVAVVGGNAQAMLDMRTSMIGRMKSGHESRLWGLIEAWTRRFGQTGRRRMMEDESKRVGRLVMKERRRARRVKRRARRRARERHLRRKYAVIRKAPSESEEAVAVAAAGGGGEGVDDFDDGPEDTIGDEAPRGGPASREAEEHDLEGSIFEYYRDAAAAAGTDTDALHPAFRTSVAYDPESGTFHHQRPKQSPPQPARWPLEGASNRAAGTTSRPTFYTQSAYSQDDGLDSGFGGSSSTPSSSQNQGQQGQQGNSSTPAIANPITKASSSCRQQDKSVAENRAESYQKLVSHPAEDSRASLLPPSDVAVREYMKNLWGYETRDEADEEEEEEEQEDPAEEEARDARVQRALADAYPDRSRTDEEDKEMRSSHMTTWGDMMKKGGAPKWLGSS